MAANQLVFEDRAAFRTWLSQHHQDSPGAWLVFSKTHRLKTLSANEALEEALCFGWIDGQLQSLGTQKYIKRFTPRRKDSAWSEKNRMLAQRLVKEGVMTSAGEAAIARAQNGGTWEGQKRAPVSEEQIETLTKAISAAGADAALRNLLNMSPSIRKTYSAFYLDAKKEETRKRRLDRIIERLEQNKGPM